MNKNRSSEFQIVDNHCGGAHINLTTTKPGRLNAANNLTLRTVSEIRSSAPDEGPQCAIPCLNTKENKRNHKSVRLLQQKYLMPHVNLSLSA